MYKLVLFFINLYVSMLLGAYEIGDTMTVADQYFEYDVCYGEYPEEVFKFADINGSINGGDYKVAVIGLSATWWPNCVSSSFDVIEEYFEGDSRIAFLENLSDLNQPYTCEQWGNLGQDNFPLIFTEIDNPYYFYNSWEGVTDFNTAIILNHDLVYIASPNASSYIVIETILESLLEELPAGIAGDLNGDDFVNILDIIIIANLILDGEYIMNADVNDDAILNILDIIVLVNIILNT